MKRVFEWWTTGTKKQRPKKEITQEWYILSGLPNKVVETAEKQEKNSVF